MCVEQCAFDVIFSTGIPQQWHKMLKHIYFEITSIVSSRFSMLNRVYVNVYCIVSEKGSTGYNNNYFQERILLQIEKSLFQWNPQNHLNFYPLSTPKAIPLLSLSVKHILCGNEDLQPCAAAVHYPQCFSSQLW